MWPYINISRHCAIEKALRVKEEYSYHFLYKHVERKYVRGPLGGVCESKYDGWLDCDCQPSENGQLLIDKIQAGDKLSWSDEYHVGSALMIAAQQGDAKMVRKILDRVLFFGPIMPAIEQILQHNLLLSVCEYVASLSKHKRDICMRFKFYQLITEKCLGDASYANHLNAGTMEWLLATMSDDDLDTLTKNDTFMENVKRLKCEPMIKLRRLKKYVTRAELSELTRFIRWLGRYDFYRVHKNDDVLECEPRGNIIGFCDMTQSHFYNDSTIILSFMHEDKNFCAAYEIQCSIHEYPSPRFSLPWY